MANSATAEQRGGRTALTAQGAMTFKQGLAWDIIVRVRWIAGQRFMVPRGTFETSSWIFGHGTYAQIGQQRLVFVADWYGRWALTTYFSILAMFLAGVRALRSGFFERVIKDPRATRRLLLNPRHLIVHAIDFSTEATALVYAALLVLAFQTTRGARLLAPLAATGRMGLTTYLTQSVVCTFLFYKLGIGVVRPSRLHRNARHYAHALRTPDGSEHVVAQAVSLRSGGVALENAHIRKPARDESIARAIRRLQPADEVQLLQQSHEPRLRTERIEHRVLSKPRHHLGISGERPFEIVECTRMVAESEIDQRRVERQHLTILRHLL